MKKRVGILGGMGPAATVQLFDLIIRATPASSDQEHLHILINNNPTIPDRSAAISGGGTSPLNALVDNAQLLADMGADFVVMPCNSAHYFWDAIQKRLKIPILNMIHETARAVRREHPDARQIGVLATSGTLDARMYQDALKAERLTALEPTAADKAQIMDAIYSIKAGDLGIRPTGQLAQAAQALIARGAEVIIMGCTEIPLVLTDGDVAVPLVSSTHILAQAAVHYALEAASPSPKTMG